MSNRFKIGFICLFVLVLNKFSSCQIVGEGSDEGSMLFLTPGLENVKLGNRNVDYYDKISFVISMLDERRNVEEGKILDSFRDEVRVVEIEPLTTSRPKRGSRRPRLRVSRPSLEVREIDTSWKDGRCLYPKRSSQVGAGYQVAFLPRAGTIETEKQSQEAK